MAALTSKRGVRTFTSKSIEMLGKTEQVYQGGLACIDTSTGLVAKGFASTTLIPIGVFAEDQNTASGGTVLVKLFEELVATWYPNSAAGADLLAVAQIGSDCYIADDNVVAKTSATSTRSIIGRVWKIDSAKGVLVSSQRR